jgi:hypothetical protein
MWFHIMMHMLTWWLHGIYVALMWSLYGIICGAYVTFFVPLGNTCLHMGTHVLIFHQPTWKLFILETCSNKVGNLVPIVPNGTNVHSRMGGEHTFPCLATCHFMVMCIPTMCLGPITSPNEDNSLYMGKVAWSNHQLYHTIPSQSPERKWGKW